MLRTIVNKLVLVALLPFVFAGCDSLFDEGHTERSYDGPPQVGFFPLEQEVSDAAGSTTVEVQLIATEHDSDVSVNYSVDTANSTAVEGEHFTIATGSPVTLPSGQWTVDVTINLIEGSVDGEVRLDLQIDSSSAEVADNFRTARIYIQG